MIIKDALHTYIIADCNNYSFSKMLCICKLQYISLCLKARDLFMYKLKQFYPLTTIFMLHNKTHMTFALGHILFIFQNLYKY